MLTFAEFIAEERLWYHGTSGKNYKKIKASGHLKPHVADDQSVGAAVWFTSNPDEARTYAKKKNDVVLAIPHSKLKQYKHTRLSSIPRGWGKKYGMKSDYYHMAAHENIPIEHLREVPAAENHKTRKP